MRNVVAFALGVLLVSPAGADERFLQTINIWTVEKIFDSCLAYNRPDTEMKDVAIHALGLSRDADGTTNIVAAFWPDALASDDVTLTVKVNDMATDLNAKQLDAGLTLISGALPEALVQELKTPHAKSQTMQMQAGPSGVEMSFDMSDLPAVMATLDACANGLKT
ncbi:MAG: hypothetical protein ABI459_06300 [Deltaproteobacteria bacterium]